MRVDVAATCCGSTPSSTATTTCSGRCVERHGYDFDAVDIGERQDGRVHTDLPRLRAGGVGAQFWSVYVPSTMGPEAVGATLEQVDAAYRMVERYADRLALATTADEVEAAWASGRVASLLGAEGGHQIDGSLAVLRMYHRLGRALPDPDPQRQRGLGRLGHRRAGARRAQRRGSRAWSPR